jgi:arginase
MNCTLIQVPYDSGRFAERMGRGPLHLIERGLLESLRAAGHDAELVELRLPERFAAEPGAAAELQRRVAKAAGEARAAGRVPVVLSGNCNTAVGTLAGTERAAIVWLDAHGDLNTPETSPSGFFDGMALAIATGACWRPLAATVPGFRPVEERRVALVGARHFDPAERERLEASEIHWFRRGGDEIRQWLDEVDADRVYLHLDLDVLDPQDLRANGFAVPGGLRLEEVEEIARTVSGRLELAGLAVTAYDPEQDEEDRGPAVALRLIRAALEAQPSPARRR